MGGKITIDSATLMNKGLELIEAHHLFDVPYAQIEVVVHPQSIVHGTVMLRDGAVLAHLGHPDMRVPIAYALHHPQRVELATRGSIWRRSAPEFEAPDLDRSRALRARARGGRCRRHRALRAERRQRGRGARVHRRPDRLPAHRRGDRGGARRARRSSRCASSTRCSRSTGARGRLRADCSSGTGPRGD